jgi:hypothetical protein
MPVKATLWNEGKIDDVDIIVTFDKDGNAIKPEPEKTEKRYELDYGFLDIGITVWNRAEEVNGECPTVAYISPEREVTVCDKDMPQEIIDKIERMAKSPETWAFDFAPAPGKQYDLGYGFMGNGITVWNRAEEANNDYVTVARIERDRSVAFYDSAMPDDVKSSIENAARTIDDPALDPLPQSETPKQTTLDLSLPDPTMTAAAINGYGYTEPDMYPLSGDRALELFDAGHTIYLLYDDNTEAMALDRDEIITFSGDGFCGITKTDWEMSPVRDAQNKVCEDAISNREQSENSRESDLLYGDNPYYCENKYGIYQIKDDIDEARNFRFAPMKELEAHGLTVNRDNYALIYVGDLPGRVEFLRDKTTALNSLFEKFNTDRPADYMGRSISVGDVVVLRCNGDITAHFVDSAGFMELPDFAGKRAKSAEMPGVMERLDEAKKRNAQNAPAAAGRNNKERESL